MVRCSAVPQGMSTRWHVCSRRDGSPPVCGYSPTPDDVRVLERLLSRSVLTGLTVGIGLVSVVMLNTEAVPMISVLGVRFLEVLGWTGLGLATILLLRVLLALLRTEPTTKAR